MSNFDHVLGVVPQTRVFGGNRTHDPYAISLAHYLLDYQGTREITVLDYSEHSHIKKIIE